MTKINVSNIALSNHCLAIAANGRQCKRVAIEGSPYCSTHLKISPYVAIKRRKLSRKEIAQLIKINGGSQDLDLSYTDLSDLKLGSSIEKMLPFDGVVFGKYGDILSGVIAERTIFVRNSFRGAKFIGARLRETNFFLSDLSGADLRFSDLTDARLGYANLSGANLFDTKLINTNLRDVNLHGADLYRVVLEGRTELVKESIGETLLQEDEKAYREFIERNVLTDSNNPIEHHLKDRFFKAYRIYENLRVHFDSNGNTSDANWAYLKERRMKKKWHGAQRLLYFQEKKWGKSITAFFQWLSDWIVELLCDYGESVWRVVFWMAALVFLIGPLLLSMFGGLTWDELNLSNVILFRTYKDALFIHVYLQYILYMIDVLTTSNFSVLYPANDVIRFISGLFSLISIFLAGLLGFVAGNRIRNS